MSSYPITDAAMRWLEVVLAERYGHAWKLSRLKTGLRLQLIGAGGAIFFDTLCEGFTQAHSEQPFTRWDAQAEGWGSVLCGLLPAPGVVELPSPLIEQRGTEHVIHYDILGLTYWSLARVEEVGRIDLDNHDRFPAVSSHTYKHDYLERPVVDEWLHILGQVIQRIWHGIKLKQHNYSIKVSHDVDRPSLYAFESWKTIGQMMASHLLKQRDINAFFNAPYIKLATKNSLHELDPYNTFDWLMDVSEANNLKSAFYFICGGNHTLDASYDLGDTIIRNLIRHIHSRGHEIGLHPSYDSFKRPDLIKKEINRLKSICAEEEVEQTQWGGRMHYLRWNQPTTLRAWEDAGMNYDFTLGYADRPGFRCGTCHEYPAFDPVAQEQLRLRIRPLIMMESAVIDGIYLGLDQTVAAEDKMMQLKITCQQVSGVCGILWHNSYFKSEKLRLIYQRLLCG